MAPQILRLLRTDVKNEHLLVNVKQTRQGFLDLKLIGTDQEHLYHAGIKESDINSLQSSNYSGDQNEWKTILKYAFLHERPDAAASQDDVLEGVEVVAAISGSSLTITLRKNISGITQRLGSIKLEQDDEREEVSPFEWVDTAVAAADDLRHQLETLQASISGQQGEVTKLNKQLDELVQAKRDHEAELIKKFAALLNTKKLKIRDQQRLLNGAKIDPRVAEATRAARDGTVAKGRAAKGSRSGKRKADEVELDDEEDEDEEMEDGPLMDAMDDYDEEKREEETPPHSQDEATEDEEDLDAPPPPSAEGEGKTNGRAKGQANAKATQDEDEVPPRRNLPFQRKDAPPASKPPPKAPMEEEDDDTDDEL